MKNFETEAALDTALNATPVDLIGLAVDDGIIKRMRHHDWVEIAGIKWATMNVGARRIHESGLYFQWGDTRGYTASQVGSGVGKKTNSWPNYKFYGGNSTTFTKYNNTDKKILLDLEDDAVRAAWGGSWRMPTAAELQALGDAVDAVWTTDYNGSGVNGLVCTDKTDSSKVLFFPASGWGVNNSINYIGSHGSVTCASRTNNVSYICRLYFTSNYVEWANEGITRNYLLSCRGVLADS